MERSGAFNWSGDLKTKRTCNDHDESVRIVDDSEYTQSLIREHPVLSRIGLLDNQFVAQKRLNNQTQD